MQQLTLSWQGQTLTAPHGTTAHALLSPFHDQAQPLVAVLINHHLQSLRRPLEVSGDLEPVRLDSSHGHKVYRRSLCFLLGRAAAQVLPGRSLHIGPSMDDAYLFLPADGQPLTPAEVSALEAALRRLVQDNHPLQPVTLSYQEALRRFPEDRDPETRLLILQKNEPEVHCVEGAGAWDLEHFPLVPDTGLLNVFALVPYKEGCLLRFPEKRWPLQLVAGEDRPFLYNIYSEFKAWGQILGVPSIPRLNEIAQSKDIAHFVQVAETLQEKKLSQLADTISARRDQLKVILIAGPSSSGKTTFTKKLAIHLQVLGFKPRLLSLDDYFVAREDTPKDADGNYDFEALHALDIPLLNQHLVALLDGQEVEIPVFDFKVGHRKESGHKLQLGPRDILLMEGIHGLNNALTPSIPAARKFRIYISALTPLNLDSHNRISTTDNRLIRRLVRDYQFRGYSALHTLKMWPSVRRGEDKNIFPFQEGADAVFNSALDYELAVLKNLAVPLLHTVPPTEKEYTQARLLLDFLENFTPIPVLHVPTFSLLREFLGNSGFKY